MEQAIRHMWAGGRPDPDTIAAGFPVLPEATHSLVFAGERTAGAYNHHSQLTWRTQWVRRTSGAPPCRWERGRSFQLRW